MLKVPSEDALVQTRLVVMCLDKLDISKEENRLAYFAEQATDEQKQ